MSKGSGVGAGLRGDVTTAAGEALVAAILAHGLIASRGDMSNEEALEIYHQVLDRLRS